MKYFHLCTVAALSAISTVMLSACQKPHQVSCGDATVQNQLLELTANIAQSNFISAKIIKISEIQPATEATNLSCQTTILYTYSLFPKSAIQQNYAFSINNQQQITEFDTDKTQQQKFSL
jgi:hypothetical protein